MADTKKNASTNASIRMLPVKSICPALRRDTARDDPNADTAYYNLTGDWTVEQAKACMQVLENVEPSGRQHIICDGVGVQRLDISGAWLLVNRAKALRANGRTINFINFAERDAHFLDEVEELKIRAPATPQASASLIAKAVQHFDRLSASFINSMIFLGTFWCLLGDTLLHPRQFRIRDFIRQCEVSAVRAAPIVAFMTFLIAVVLAYQGAAQLRRFGAEIFSINLVTISVLREMGVLLTSIMLAGRSGSAFAAEIGTMKLNEELDALKTTGMDPMEVLVLPRVLALTIMMPLLTFLGDMTGILGSGILTITTSGTSWPLYLARLTGALHMKDFWIGIGKAPVFGLMVGLVGCYHGMAVTNSAESVGRETTASVVNAIFMVMLADALFSIVFTLIGI